MSLPSPRALRAGVPVFRFPPQPDGLSVAVLRLGPEHAPHGAPHIHDFPLMQLSSRSGGGEVRVVAAGAVVDPAPVPGLATTTAVLFDPAVLGIDAAPVDWPEHPLLAVFAHRTADGVLRLPVAEDRARLWRNEIDALEAELASTEVGADAAAIARLTLLLVDLARLAAPRLADRRPVDPLVRAAAALIEARYAEQISLADVAAALSVSPGHLATTVRRDTGRTVVQWITDRRMAAARRALSGSRTPIAQIARAVGYPDPAYFSRVFRRVHGVSARAWREASAR